MAECSICGEQVGGNTNDLRAHNEWCAHVDWILGQAKEGVEITPDMGSAHQLAEALNRLSDPADRGGSEDGQ